MNVVHRESLPGPVLQEFEVLYARLKAFLGKDHDDAGNNIAPSWTNYAPELFEATLGTGRLRGRYLRQGVIVFYQIFFELAADTALTSNPIRISLPVPSTGVGATAPWIVDPTFLTPARAYVGGADYFGLAQASGNSVQFFDETNGFWTSAFPAAWAPGDILQVSGFYDVAAGAVGSKDV